MVLQLLRISLSLRFLETSEVLPEPPSLLFDIGVVRYGVRLLASSHKQLMDTREELVATVKSKCGVDLTVMAKAEAPFSSTNRTLDTVYDTAIDGVECLFEEAKRSRNTVRAQSARFHSRSIGDQLTWLGGC